MQSNGEGQADADRRPCERLCATCNKWKHHSRFRAAKLCNDVVSRFAPSCRDCEQKVRNERKNADRPMAIIKQRAIVAARKAGASAEFFMVEMNYRALVPMMRAFMSKEGLCLCCGHAFVSESDIHIEHVEPPRGEQDWARLHARNLRLCCASCNRTKGKKVYSDWLDDQEGARLSNLASEEVPYDAIQGRLFEF